MIMATEKRKSAGGPAGGTPSKFQKNQQGGKSPMGGGGGKAGFSPKQQQKGSPQKSPNKPNQKPGNQRPPPPPKGAKQLKVEVKQDSKKPNQQNQKQGGKPFQKKGKDTSANGALNKVSEQSKTIKKNKKRMSGQKKQFNKLDTKPRDRADCERALQAEIELGHTGRVFTVKLPDPVVNSEVVKSWSNAIETSVFPKPVEPRQLFIVFKNNVNVKKEVENLKKVTFGGGKLVVEERIEGENAKIADQIDPFSLYLSNVHEKATKEELQKLFKKAASVSTPKKHGPRVQSQTKFAFVIYENTDDALAAFKENYTSVLHGNTLVMRFRRIATRELHQQQSNEKKVAAAAALAETKKNVAAVKKQAPAPAQTKAGKKQPVKKEPESDEDEDDDEDDEEEEGMEGVKMDEDEDESGDDEEDDEEDEEESDEDEDDDDDDEEDDE